MLPVIQCLNTVILYVLFCFLVVCGGRVIPVLELNGLKSFLQN